MWAVGGKAIPFFHFSTPYVGGGANVPPFFVSRETLESGAGAGAGRSGERRDKIFFSE